MFYHTFFPEAARDSKKKGARESGRPGGCGIQLVFSGGGSVVKPLMVRWATWAPRSSVTSTA